MLSFHSEEERRAHPEAGLIPTVVWNTFFKQGLSDETLQIMKQPNAPVKPVNDDHAAWLAYAYSHPELDDDSLIKAAHQMQVSTLDQLRFSAAFGRSSLFGSIYDGLDKTYLRTLLEANQYEIFRIAAKLDNAAIIQKILDFKNSPDQAGKEALTSIAIAFVSAGLMGLQSHLSYLGLAMEIMRPALSALQSSSITDQAISAALFEAIKQKAPSTWTNLFALYPHKAPKIMINIIAQHFDAEQMLEENDLSLFKNPVIANHYQKSINRRLINATLDGDLDRMKKYAEISPNKEQVLGDFREVEPGILWGFFGSYNYNILMKTKESNRTEVILTLLEWVPNKAKELILHTSYYDYSSMLREAYNKNETRLLEAYFPYVFSEILHAKNYRDIKQYFTETKLSKLRENPQEINQLALNKESAKLYFSVMIGLVSEPGKSADFNLLLQIPTLNKMLIDNPQPVFEAAYQANNTAIIHQLCSLPAALEHANKHDFYQLFNQPAKATTVLTLLNYVQDKKRLFSHDNSILYTNLKEKNDEIIRMLFNYTDDLTLKILQRDNYLAFSKAVYSTEMFDFFSASLDPTQIQEMLRANLYYVFTEAVQEANVDLVNKIITMTPPENRERMLKSRDYSAFLSACSNKEALLFHTLIELTTSTETLQDMLKTQDYRAFYLAAESEHSSVFEQLLDERYWQYVPQNHVSTIIHASQDKPFKTAAIEGNLSLVNRLIELSSPAELNRMGSSASCIEAFYRTRNPDIRKKLLSFLPIFIHAESHDYEYRNDVYPFVDQHLSLLYQNMQTFEHQNPHGVFDLPSEEATFAFYCLRNLIRRNDPALNDNIRFLLNIPAVKALVAREVTPGRPNELLRLAMTTNNQQAATILLTIPEVNRLAQEHNYYTNTRRPQAQNNYHFRTQGSNNIFDIAALARDAESSMLALSEDEQQRLQAVIKRYEPQLMMQGSAKIMTNLRNQLAERYQAHPAVLMRNQSEIKLPLCWEDFQAMELKPVERKLALQAYYKNKDHSALRYLSKPNHWMHANALYTNREGNEQWSTFPEYERLISMLFLATQDPDITLLCDDHTLATRMDHFVDELAHIGRAHNWDQKRIKKNTQGEICYNKQGNPIYEDYDDLAGDRPSCYSGVKRRLFQAVQGHTLLKQLSLDIVKLELREFVRQYYNEKINDNNRLQLKEAWENTINSQTDDRLNELNIPETKQQAFITYMNQKYPNDFRNAPAFNKYIQSKFRLDKTCPNHAMRFFEDAGLEALLQTTNAHAVEENTSPQTTPPVAPTEITPFYKLSLSLKQCPKFGEAFINELTALKPNASHTAAIWANASEKLNAIIHAITAFPEVSDEHLYHALSDSESALSQALRQKPTFDRPFRDAIQQIVDEFDAHTPDAPISS